MEEVIKKQVAANGSFVQRLRFWFYDKRWYFAAFFLPVAIMFIAYAVFKVFPFGDNSALVPTFASCIIIIDIGIIVLGRI